MPLHSLPLFHDDFADALLYFSRPWLMFLLSWCNVFGKNRYLPYPTCMNLLFAAYTAVMIRPVRLVYDELT